jgi:hypothetical protein
MYALSGIRTHVLSVRTVKAFFALVRLPLESAFLFLTFILNLLLESGIIIYIMVLSVVARSP